MNLWASTGGGAATTRSRGRRRIAVWAMLMFLLSLLVQYATFVGTSPQVHDAVTSPGFVDWVPCRDESDPGSRNGTRGPDESVGRACVLPGSPPWTRRAPRQAHADVQETSN